MMSPLFRYSALLLLASLAQPIPAAPAHSQAKNTASSRTASPTQPRSSATRSSRSTSAASHTASSASYVSQSHAPSAPRSYVTDWPTGKKLIALTYDDGPDPKITPKLIELLQAKKVPATFYVLGERVHEYPALARRLHELGYEVVNHTYDHKLLTKLSDDQVLSELTRTNDLITSVTGAPVPHMRPPYGGRNPRVDSIIKGLGMQIVLWDVDTEDWRKRSADQMISNIMKNAHDGSIILFHDRYQSSLDATAAVIDGLRARGYTFVTVGEMLAQPKQTNLPAHAESVTTVTALRASE